MNTESIQNSKEVACFIPSDKPTTAERRFFSKLEMLERGGIKVTKTWEDGTSCFGEKMTISASVSSHPGSDFGVFMSWTLVRPFGGETCTKRTSLSFFGMSYAKGHPRVSEAQAMRIYSVCKMR